MCVYKAPANFIIPNLPTEFPFGFGMKNTGKIPKGSYRNTESVYNSSKYQPKLPSVRHIHFGITVGIFLLYDLAGTPFEDFAGTLFLKIWRELLF